MVERELNSNENKPRGRNRRGLDSNSDLHKRRSLTSIAITTSRNHLWISKIDFSHQSNNFINNKSNNSTTSNSKNSSILLSSLDSHQWSNSTKDLPTTCPYTKSSLNSISTKQKNRERWRNSKDSRKRQRGRRSWQNRQSKNKL